MKPKNKFIYPDELEAYGEALKSLSALDLQDEISREMNALRAKARIIEAACTSNDDLDEDVVYLLMLEISEHFDKVKAGNDELFNRLSGHDVKGEEADGENGKD